MRPILHPSFDRLVRFVENDQAASRAGRVATHLRRCQECRETLRFISRVQRVSTELPPLVAPGGLLDCIIEARATGERRVLPGVSAGELAPRSTRRTIDRGRLWWGVAAASIIGITTVLFNAQADRLEAAARDSELELSPTAPRVGDTIRARYRPAPHLFAGTDSLVLRARFRRVYDPMYADAVPTAQVRPVAILRHTGAGEFTGSFAMPDSFVFASLVVEDVEAGQVDDRSGKPWEVLLHTRDGQPTFDALNQRANDMMGRSWEEAYATARQLTALYPDSLRSWTLREFFERALLGDSSAEPVTRASRSRFDSLVETARSRRALSSDDLGVIFFRVWTTTMSRHTAADSAELAYWWRRLRDEYPRHEQIAQRYAIDLGRALAERPRALLDTLDRLYPTLAPLTGPGKNMSYTALNAADRLGDAAEYRTWLGRSLAGSPDSALRDALALSSRAKLRPEAMIELRALATQPPARLGVSRLLTETAAQYQQRVRDVRQGVLAALGRALVAEGHTRAGLDTLALATAGVWDVGLFHDVAAAQRLAGDTIAALSVEARLAVDPRTPADSVVALTRTGRKRLGAQAWDSLLFEARTTLRRLLLERTTNRPLRGAARLADAAGHRYSLSELTSGKPSVVMFWSRHCGPALEALPAIAEVIARLERGGTPVVFVLDEHPSAELSRFLALKHVRWPVYFDVSGSTKIAFANFGTPTYYVIDAAKQVRFDHADGEAEIIAQVDALKAGTR